jgi:hypothetical protein
LASPNPTRFSIEALNALGARPFDHAEDLSATLEFEPIVLDLKLAARACGNFASLRFAVGEIAGNATTLCGTRLALLDALEEAEQ